MGGPWSLIMSLIIYMEIQRKESQKNGLKSQGVLSYQGCLSSKVQLDKSA